MRNLERGNAPSGILQDFDGTKGRRNLTPVEITGLVAIGSACTLAAVCLDLRQSPKEVIKIVAQGTKALVSKSYREKIEREYQESLDKPLE